MASESYRLSEETEVAVNNSRIATLELNITMTRNVNMTMQYI